MINLNLLPPIKKQEFHLAQIYILIKDLIILILLITIIIAIILLVAKYILQNNFNRVVEQTTQTTRYAVTLNKDIRSFNESVSSVEKIQKKYVSWLDFIIQFNKLIPDEISVYNVSVKENKILINGAAKTREKLLELKSNLEQSTLLTNVVVPLENLLKKQNVDFTIKADLTSSKSQ